MTLLSGALASLSIFASSPAVAADNFRPGPAELFRRLDADGDGRVSKAEFLAGMKQSPRWRDNPQGAETFFSRLDTNGDGYLSSEEFARLGQFMGGRPGEQSRQQIDAAFNILDANHDGKLDRQEFSRIVDYNARLRQNPSQVDQLFGYLDKNQDNLITLDEYRAINEVQQMAARMGQFNPEPEKPKAAEPVKAMPDRPATTEELAFFEKKIRPVLADKCYKCHSSESERVKGGLLLDTKESARNGGDSGHAVVPGDLTASLLIKAIRYSDNDLKMPPEKNGGKLPPEVVADFEKWIQMGAPDPREGKLATKREINLEKGREHWAFQSPKKTVAPAVKDTAWARTDFDRYVLANLEEKGLQPVGDADPRALIRRLYFDLIGLPPTPEQTEAFVKDYQASRNNPNAVIGKVTDELLASPQFGERWGRHWLDVARYAESSGKEVNLAYPHAWRYRDYVIQSFNADKPYDRFLKEQLAGDLLPAATVAQKAELEVATGFLAIGPKSHNNRDTRQFMLDVADEQIDAVSQGMLGLTVACARCHDHKFDPIPTKDYYALAGIFLSTETRYGTPRLIQNNQPSPLVRLPEDASVTEPQPLSYREMTQLRRRLEQAQKQRDTTLAEARQKGDRQQLMGNIQLIQSQAQIAVIEQVLARYDNEGRPSMELAMGVQDRMLPADTQVLVRGETDRPSETVPRGFVQVVSTGQAPKIQKGSGRLELAEWITSPENPLTARVMANRVWLHLFGRGLVASTDNFGTTGQKPSNPVLLDQLSIYFVEHGWSVKQLIREIVLSRTYQLASTYNAQDYAQDPDNVSLWRMTPRRLDAEAIRDAMLDVSGRLQLSPPRGSQVASFEGPVNQLLRLGSLQQEENYRSVYLPIVRDQVPESLAVFDFAEPSLVTGNREDTTVPAQALYLLNSPTVLHLAEAMADRIWQRAASSEDRRREAFELAFGRPPTEQEKKSTAAFFQKFFGTEGTRAQGQQSVERSALVAFCQALLGSAEFRYLN